MKKVLVLAAVAALSVPAVAMAADRVTIETTLDGVRERTVACEDPMFRRARTPHTRLDVVGVERSANDESIVVNLALPQRPRNEIAGALLRPSEVTLWNYSSRRITYKLDCG
jgi:hypothetical protein